MDVARTVRVLKLGKRALTVCQRGKKQTCSNQPIRPLQAQLLGFQSQVTPLTTSPCSSHALSSDGEPQTVVHEPRPELLPTIEHTDSDQDRLPDLPVFKPHANPEFSWGALDSSRFSTVLETAYDETVHWRKNCFKIPHGNAGKSFVNELARLFQAFATGSALESVALKAAMTLPPLLLQKPHRNSKTKTLIACLERRMKLWEEGDIPELVREGRAIQNRLPKR